MNFAYTAVDPSGKRTTGVIEARDRDAAIATVIAQGKFVLELTEEKKSSGSAVLGSQSRVSKADLALFTRRMADLALAGLPLDRVLQVIGEQSESPALTQVAEQALEDVRGGQPISVALAKHPKFFSNVFTETLRAGEASGQFGEVASRLADFQEKDVIRRSQITSAMIYPMILLVFAVGVIIFLLTFVVPKLAPIFDQLGNDLPASTKALLGITALLTNNYLVILGAIGGGFILYRGWVATEAGAYTKDQFLLKMPVGGKILGKAVVSRYARVLSTLVFGGVPMLEALRLSGLATGNRVFQRTSESVAEAVREGKAIHEAMEATHKFPPVLTHMVAIGEETGDLPKMLSRVSDSLDFEVDQGMRRLTSMVEPVIVLGMGFFVGFVVLSVLLPIFQAQDVVK